MKVQIIATMVDCTVEKLSFEQERISLEYQIGTGSLTEALPAVKQVPDCGLVFNNYYVKSVTGDIS